MPQGKGDVLRHRHAVEQRRLLEEKAEAVALVGQLPLAERGQVLPVKDRPSPASAAQVR